MMVKRNYRAIGEYFRQKREAADLTQGEVAKSFGYTSAQFVSNIERGLAMFPMNCLRQIIVMYKLDADEVLDLLIEDESKYLRMVIKGKFELPKRKMRKKWKKKRF